MDLYVIGMTCGTAGKILIAYTAISVHHRFRKEHKIDDKVFSSMRREQRFALLGIGLLVAEYVLQIINHFA